MHNRQITNRRLPVAENLVDGDENRIIQTPAFQALRCKTQLIPNPQGRGYRDRFKHTFEVTATAQQMARFVNSELLAFQYVAVNESIIRAASIAHDIGHPPFGHVGERILDSCMKEWGGFESNAQSLRILSECDIIVSHDTIAVLLKHSNRIPAWRATDEPIVKGFYSDAKPIVQEIASNPNHNQREKFIVDFADDVSNAIMDIVDLIRFFGVSTFCTSLYKNFTIYSLRKVCEATGDTYFCQFPDSYLQQIISDLYNMLLVGIVSANRDRRRHALQQTHRFFISSIEIQQFCKRNYSFQIGSTLYASHMLKTLQLIPPLCYLNTDVNKNNERLINDCLLSLFNALMQPHQGICPLEWEEVLDQATTDSERARKAADLISLISDPEVLKLLDLDVNLFSC